jgi:hypothetical protein
VDTTAKIVCADSTEGLSVFVVASPDCVDEDGDGYGDPASEGCPHPQADCDDTDPTVHPGATEGPSGDATCSDGKDNDCDLAIDTDDTGCENGSCSASASASVPGAYTIQGHSKGPGLVFFLVALVMTGIVLRVVRWRLHSSG